ncbi:MAG: phosphoenolpyruvate synthase [Firmicutes bacterium]|nr:phosphoenolpyruvate synthase [Bacillota bacterium]
MQVYERVSTGLNGLDKVLDQLRLGDNVVWQVDSIDDYRHFVEPFVRNALLENRKIVYIRFGQHEEVVTAQPGVKVYQLNPNQGFESFSNEVHTIATSEGEGAFYVFDSLSALLSVWANDLMIGNFFKVTCPYLFELNTIGYFAVLRGMNSYQTIARIRETTQLLLDIYCFEGRFYLHPLKVWNRYSPTMFLPHVGSGEDFMPITSSVEAARLFSHFQRQGLGDAGRKLDYWDRVFIKAQELMEKLETGDTIYQIEEREMVEDLCRMMIGREERLLALARKYFSLKDLLKIRNRLIGSGYIGGKTVGMLLARNILRNDPHTRWPFLLETHDSFYIGSDVYYTYLVENDCWKLHLEQKKAEHYFSAAAELKQRILEGNISSVIREEFQQMLEYFGQSPIIVRSSSLLEDGFGNAFAGKYASHFCVNQGTPQERYQYFEEAIKSIFASTMSEDALAYRQKRGLAKCDEQMALLVQRVSGSYHGRYFFPDLAGVALSYNPFVWREDLDPQSGMMRLVLGLGTRAVDRVEDDYPRIVALDKPLARPDSSIDEIRRFSQHKVDLLDTQTNQWSTEPLNHVAELMSGLPNWNLWAIRDKEATSKMRELGIEDKEAWVLNFKKLLGGTSFAPIIQKMLQTLEKAYDYPVDIEFTANFDQNGEFQINLLQCRPLQTYQKARAQTGQFTPPPNDILFKTKNSFMGEDALQTVNRIIYVQPEEYSILPISDKYQIARVVGYLNRLHSDRESTQLMLIGPGRWGTSTPALGIPVSFAEISNTSVLVEVAFPKGGYAPELSFGTHFFQDLVENHIFYVALFPGSDGVSFNWEFFDQAENSLVQMFPEYMKWEKVIKLIDLADLKRTLWLDANLSSRQLQCYLL